VKAFQRCRDATTEGAKNAAIKERNRVLRTEKAIDFRRKIHNAAESRKGIWGFAKWARNDSSSPRPLPKFPPLRRGDGEGVAETFEEKVEVLRTTFFPPPPPRPT